MGSSRGGQSGGRSETELREVNEALLLSSIQQHELAEVAQRAEEAGRAREAELRRHAEEVVRFNRAAVGRELRIVELKQEINEAANRHGESAPYPLAFEEPDTPRPSHRAPTSEAAEIAAFSKDSAAPLESILCTEELTRRPSRPPNYTAENDAILALVRRLGDAPGEVLQMLAETILTTLEADSAGLSLLTQDEKYFYWPAVAGVWSPHVGGGTPRDFGPCGDVLDRNAPLLFHHIERRYTYFQAVTPAVEEALLVPFCIEGKSVGTVWAVSHGEKRFDAEDLRRLQVLAQFACAAYQASDYRRFEQSRRVAALNLMEDAVQSRETSEKTNLELRALDQKTRELAQSLAELNRRKDEFLAMLSHELRNPLASIRNATHIMRLQHDRSPIQMEAQGMIERQVLQLVRLIDDLLEVSRIATGRIRLQLERVDFRTIVHRAIETIRPQADRKGQSLTEPLSGTPVWVHGDPVRLEQVVVNLLNNASKYTNRSGKIQLTMQEEGDEVVLRVMDTGVGIAPELLPHIFELFMQADVSLDRAQGGLGIGLALVQSLVTLHHGSVEAHSTPGRGSEFVVRLPTLLHSGSNDAVAAASSVTSQQSLKILVVDDNVDAAKSMGLILESSGHTMRLSHDGASALTDAHEFLPDVVLLDIGLPVHDGYEVAKRIRTDSTLTGVVLIAMTGYGRDSDKQRAREAGFDHYLVKPVDFENLESMLRGLSADNK